MKLMNIESSAKRMLLTLMCLQLLGCGLEQDDKYRASWNTLWTIEATSGPGKVVVKAPRGAFHFVPAARPDYENFVLKTDHYFPSMEFHYPSGKPWYVWAASHCPDHINPSTPKSIECVPRETKLSFNLRLHYVDIIPYDVYSRSLRQEALERPDRFAIKKNIWPGIADEIAGKKSPSRYIVFKNPESENAAYIHCRSPTVKYCSIKGVTIKNQVHIDRISIPVNDLKNWKHYQQKAIELANKYLVAVEITQPYSPSYQSNQ